MPTSTLVLLNRVLRSASCVPAKGTRLGQQRLLRLPSGHTSSLFAVRSLPRLSKLVLETHKIRCSERITKISSKGLRLQEIKICLAGCTWCAPSRGAPSLLSIPVPTTAPLPRILLGVNKHHPLLAPFQGNETFPILFLAIVGTVLCIPFMFSGLSAQALGLPKLGRHRTAQTSIGGWDTILSASTQKLAPV